MKNMLIYNYNLINPRIYYTGNKIHIIANGEKYELICVDNLAQIRIFDKITNNELSKNYDQVVKTNANKTTVEHRNKKYILMKKSNPQKRILDILEEETMNSKNYNPKENNNGTWYDLWCEKNDRIEQIYKSTKGKDKLVDESIDYFLGMAETAIAYYKNANFTTSRNLTITHRRINEINNPLNLVVDEKERDVSEYLKYIFFKQKNYEQDLQRIEELITFANLSYEKVYARMLYPTYYFDELEKLSENKSVRKELIKIIEKTDEYEEYLKKIYERFSTKTAIKKVDWLN